MSDLRTWLVLRYDIQRDVWEEVGCTNAPDAGAAFRHVVVRATDPAVAHGPRVGEYRVVTLADSAHLGVEYSLRDLDAPENPA